MESIFKLQPNRTMALRGFNTFAAPAAIHSATADSFKVSGTFRDPGDFAVLVLWDADNYYEHASLKYLPDFDFSGCVLSFDVRYSDGVQPIDSPKYNWIDWATLDCILVPDLPAHRARIRLWDHATLSSGSFTPASGTFELTSGPDGPQAGDRLTIWFENAAWSHTVPAALTRASLGFYAGSGAPHTVTVNDRSYATPDAGGSGDVATALVSAINSGPDPDVIASVGDAPNVIDLRVRISAATSSIDILASDGNAPVSLSNQGLASIAAHFAVQINSGTNWAASSSGHAVLASADGNLLRIEAARYGFARTTGAKVTWEADVWSEKFPGLAAGQHIWLDGTSFEIASVESPTQLTLTSIPPSDFNHVLYVAPRGGRDGNMFTLYTSPLAPDGNATPNLLMTQSAIQLAGGDSTCSWQVSLDFSALGIDQLRQCWFTFAPALANGSTYSSTDWEAVFSNWVLTSPNANTELFVTGPGSFRIEESSGWCTFAGTGWLTAPGDAQDGFFSKYAAAKSLEVGDAVTISYNCGVDHSLYVGTTLYVDRGLWRVQIDGVDQDSLDCYLNPVEGAMVVTRRKIAASLPPGQHTVVLTNIDGKPLHFDFLDVAVPGRIDDPLQVHRSISPALDYDTDHSYKLPPGRIMWMLDRLGFAGPLNEYAGVFWWNQRIPDGGYIPQTTVAFSGDFLEGDQVFLHINPDPAWTPDQSSGLDAGAVFGKTVFRGETRDTVAAHLAYFINGASTGAWASAADGVLTITSRSTSAAYSLLARIDFRAVTGSGGVVTPGPDAAAGVEPVWMIDMDQVPVLTHAAAVWHTDFYNECASRGLEVTTAGSMELVLPPHGVSAQFADADRTEVATATGVRTASGMLTSHHCALGNARVIAYQQEMYREFADLQAAAGLTPCLQLGEFLWWFFPGPDMTNPVSMAYYDDETLAAAQASLGRPLANFVHANDSPQVNGGADALFLRNRLRDHSATLGAYVRSFHPDAKIEVLYPYDVNYPRPVLPGNALGGALNFFVNTPVEWRTPASSGFDRIKVEALAFTTQFRSLDLVHEAVSLFLDSGWPPESIRYLAPVFGKFQSWHKEVNVAFSKGLKTVNLWAFDHICLYSLDLLNLKSPD